MFQKGDKIVYGQTGVCIVEDVVEKALIKNEKKLYYLLKPLFQQNNVIYAPVHSDKVFMRHVITKEQAEELISLIPDIKEQMGKSDLSPEEYRAELCTHDCRDLVELTAQIYEKKKTARALKKKLGFSDEKYMRLAENLLFGELSTALDIPIESVPDYIEQKIGDK